MTSMRKRILVVEDDRDLRETILAALEGEGFDVDTAANGREALDALETRRQTSLILLDLRMPVMDGLEFRRRQLASPLLASVPVVLLSGDSRGDQQASSLGFALSMKKPIGEPDLLAVVRRFCGASS